MNGAATKFKRFISSAINHPGKQYRFKKNLRALPNGKTKVMWFTCIASQQNVMITIPLKWGDMIEESRQIAEIPVYSRQRAEYLENWWSVVSRMAKEAAIAEI